MHRRPGHHREIEIKPSMRSYALNALLRLTLGKPLTDNDDVFALRRQYERLDARQFKVLPPVERTPTEVGGVPGEWIVAPETRFERVVLYLHGGSFAFRFPNAHASLAARLCRRLGARAFIPDYRLAPEHPFPAAPDDCHAVYRGLVAQGVDPANIVLAGDSAGGNLALVTLLRTLAAGERLPACAILLAPAVDCTMGSPSMASFDGQDPLIRLASLLVLRRLYVPSPHQYTDPEVSPLFGDFHGFPPLLFQVGSTELLRDEATRAADKAFAAGVDVECELWPGALHAFQLAEFLPEARLAIDHIVRFVRVHAGWTEPGVE
jgi:monoterpene epsilon-lactone hydrolase